MSSSERTVSSLSASSSPMHERKKGVVPSSASLQQKEDLLRKKKAKRTLGGVAAFDDDGMPMQALPPAKQKRNPLVLVGAVVTAGVLGCGLVSFYQGNQVLAQSRALSDMFAGFVKLRSLRCLMSHIGKSGHIANAAKKSE